MMGIRRFNIFSGLLTISLVFLSLMANSQPTEPPLVPIDGGVSILIAAGALFGAKKVYEFGKSKIK